MWYIPTMSPPGLSLLRCDLRGLCGVHRQSWNLGVNQGSVKALPPEATTSTYGMGSSCPWAPSQVLAVKINLDGAGYVAWGANTGQRAASKSAGPKSRLEVSGGRPSACRRESLCCRPSSHPAYSHLALRPASRQKMAFVPSKAPWFVASPFGRVYPLASTAEVSKFATSDTFGLPRGSNFNIMLDVSKSTQKDGTPTLYAATGRGSATAAPCNGFSKMAAVSSCISWEALRPGFSNTSCIVGDI